MKAVAFLSRFALICNILFVFCLVMQFSKLVINSFAVNSTIVTLGWIVAPFINLVVCILYLFRAVARKPLGAPAWLVTLNIIFLFAQIFKHFILVA